MMSPA